MKYAFSSVLFLCLSLIASAGEEEFKSSRVRSAKKRYEQAVERAKQEAARKIETAKKKYQATLGREMKAATRKADLDEANKLNAEKKRLDNPTQITVLNEPASVVISDPGILGNWLWNWNKGGQNKPITILKDGTITGVSGKWEKDNNSYNFIWIGSIDIVRLVDGRLEGQRKGGGVRVWATRPKD